MKKLGYGAKTSTKERGDEEKERSKKAIKTKKPVVAAVKPKPTAPAPDLINLDAPPT